MADMENFKKFWESVVGRPYYGTAGQEQTEKKAKTATDRRGGSEPEKTEVQT